MIKVPITTGLVVYLSISALGLLTLWFILGRRKGYEGFSMFEDAYTWQCSICGYTYVDSIHNVISVCPICGSYNKREEVRER